MKLFWSKKANLNLHCAREDIRLDDPAAAEKACARIKAAANKLARFPASGRSGKVLGTRELIIPDLPYIIVYRVHGDTVRILRLRHSEQNKRAVMTAGSMLDVRGDGCGVSAAGHSGSGTSRDCEASALRPLVWMGNAKKDLQAFPKGAQKLIADKLQLIQLGGMPKNAKPLREIGCGVFEIALRYDADAFRTVLEVQPGTTIHVLHAFQKNRGKASQHRSRKLIVSNGDIQRRRSGGKRSDYDQTGIEYEEGFGNVFADLGLEDADELFALAQLGFHVHKVLTGKELKQREIASLLGIAQSEVSHVMNGHFNLFTSDKLLAFLKRLDRKVTIQISPHKPGEPYQEVGSASERRRRDRLPPRPGAGNT